jgi:hypothetical protein
MRKSGVVLLARRKVTVLRLIVMKREILRQKTPLHPVRKSLENELGSKSGL